MDADEGPYRAETREDAHRVVDENGNAVFGCGDRTTAERWAATLNEAWKRGYKTGYRAGRSL